MTEHTPLFFQAVPDIWAGIVTSVQEIWADISAQFTQSFIADDRWLSMLKGVGITLEVAALALVIGIILGVAVATIRSAHDQAQLRPGLGKSLLGFFNAICKVYITVIRGTPIMVQLLIMNFVILISTRNLVLVAVLTFGINSGAYVAEIVRSGIMSIDPGQMEAGRSLGLSYSVTMLRIIIPQALKNILPALGNELIALLKETSIVTVIGLRDLTKAAINIQAVTYQAFMPLVGAALIYLAMVMLLSYLLGKLERRLRQSDSH